MTSARCLPSYSPSVPSPSYSSEPWPDEHTLALTPIPVGRTRPTGKFTKETRNITLVLSDQRETAQLPEYSRNALVRGKILLEDPEGILAVNLKLEGRLTLMISEGGTSTKTIVTDSYTMWTRDSSSDRTCPTTIPFACIFPSSYHDGERTRPLPPTYKFAFLDAPGLFVECSYHLTVSVTKTRNLGIWKRQKSLSTRLTYYPRTRPHRPILPSHFTFFSTVKSSPEEWRQVVSTMTTRKTSNIQPISCHLFIPSVQTFGVSDTIPFHVQLCAPASSLREFLPPDRSTPPLLSHSKSTPRVFLLRQISVEVRRQKAWRNCVIGEGKLWPLPPSAPCTDTASLDYGSNGELLQTLDWNGEVRCKEDVRNGGFNTGKLIIKDYIVLAMTPPRPLTSPLIEHRHAHPIRLVTDSWVDLAGPAEEQYT